MDEKILFLDRKIRKFNPELQKLLQSIPGVGPQTSSTCVAEIGDIERFPHAKALTAYVGLDSRVYESGTSIHGKDIFPSVVARFCAHASTMPLL